MTEHLDGRVLITEGQGCWCRLDKPTVRYERGEVLVGDVQAIGTAVYFRDQKDKGVWIYAGNAYT